MWDELQEPGANGGIPVRSQLEGLFRGGQKLLSRAVVLVLSARSHGVTAGSPEGRSRASEPRISAPWSEKAHVHGCVSRLVIDLELRMCRREWEGVSCGLCCSLLNN